MGKVRCLCCGAMLESVERHDFVECSCENGTFVDGGSAYTRFGGNNLSVIEVIEDKPLPNLMVSIDDWLGTVEEARDFDHKHEVNGDTLIRNFKEQFGYKEVIAVYSLCLGGTCIGVYNVEVWYKGRWRTMALFAVNANFSPKHPSSLFIRSIKANIRNYQYVPTTIQMHDESGKPMVEVIPDGELVFVIKKEM